MTGGSVERARPTSIAPIRGVNFMVGTPLLGCCGRGGGPFDDVTITASPSTTVTEPARATVRIPTGPTAVDLARLL